METSRIQLFKCGGIGAFSVVNCCQPLAVVPNQPSQIATAVKRIYLNEQTLNSSCISYV